MIILNSTREKLIMSTPKANLIQSIRDFLETIKSDNTFKFGPGIELIKKINHNILALDTLPAKDACKDLLHEINSFIEKIIAIHTDQNPEAHDAARTLLTNFIEYAKDIETTILIKQAELEQAMFLKRVPSITACDFHESPYEFRRCYAIGEDGYSISGDERSIINKFNTNENISKKVKAKLYSLFSDKDAREEFRIRMLSTILRETPKFQKQMAKAIIKQIKALNLPDMNDLIEPLELTDIKDTQPELPVDVEPTSGIKAKP